MVMFFLIGLNLVGLPAELFGFIIADSIVEVVLRNQLKQVTGKLGFVTPMASACWRRRDIGNSAELQCGRQGKSIGQLLFWFKTQWTARLTTRRFSRLK